MAGHNDRIVSIMEERTRESLAAGSNRSITSDDLIDGPDRLSGQRAYPYSVATTAPSSPAR